MIELLVVMVVVGLLTLVIMESQSSRSNTRRRALRIQCMMNLRQTGLAFRIWEGDHGNEYPMAVSETNGGTMEFVTGGNEFRHFQAMSNELSTPRILVCPADPEIQTPATNFTAFSNSNISYFLGIIPNDTNAMMILSGDRNITNGTSIKNGILTLTTNKPAGWTSEFHNRVGNVGMADGSVQWETMTTLRQKIAGTGVATNRVQMPVLGQ